MSERGIRRVARRRAEQEAGRRCRLGARLAAGAGAALGATVVFAPAAQAETFVVDSNADDTDGDLCDPGSDCTLREAVREANGGAADPDTIIFASSLSGEITIQNPDNPFVIEQELTIQGPGANVLAISGDDDTRVFYVDAS